MLATVKARMLTGLMVVAAAATIGLPPVVQAQTAGSHLSLADRVSRLEQQQGQGGIGLVNEVQQLRGQVQQLQGQIEELQHQLQQLQQASQDRYVDLDSRLARLEGTAPDASGTALPAAASSTDLGDVELGNSTTAAAPAVPDTGTSGDPQGEYDHAFSALRNGNFASASRLFQAFIASHPNNELTPNAYYWLGESYYGTQNYQVALQTFQQLLKRFPDDAKAPGALLKVGYSQFELKQWDQARATLEQVRQRYPDSREALLAAGRLRALGLQTAN